MATRNRLRLIGSLLSCVAALAPAAAGAQEADSDIEEIVVLGAESDASEDFAAGDSVTGFSAEDLEALGAQSVADLASFTPNLEIVTTGATTPTFFIRGVGLNDFNANATGAVALYSDDVPINAPALQLGTLYDVEAVNVLRGPQGTGLARNASAGAIKLYSRKPSGRFGGYARAEGGNFDHQDYEGAVEAPIYSDLLAGRAAFRFSRRDGTLRNRCANKPEFADRVPSPRPVELRQMGLTNTDPPWSMCGEPVPTSRISEEVPPGLPKWLNDRNNWAARGTLLFQPTLDQTWLIGLNGSSRDEFTRLGQSYGTNGSFCLNGDLANCATRVDEGGSQVRGFLGGPQQNAGYQTPEVRKRLTALAPCFMRGVDNGCLIAGVGEPGFAEFDRAKRIVAKELASELDRRPWSGDYNEAGMTQNDTWGTYVKGEIALPGALELMTVTSYDSYDRGINIDLDFSPETLFHIDTEDEGWQFTQNLKLSGVADVGETPLTWEVGGWALREQLDVFVENDFGPATGLAVSEREYTQDLLSFGLFGYGSFDFWEDFTIDGGVRYNWENKTIDYLLVNVNQDVPLEEDETWDALTGTIRLLYRIRQDTHLSFKYTRGWKPGHYNATGSEVQGVTIAEPETIDSFEFGLQGSWFDGFFNLDGSLFYYNYNDYQIFTAQQFAGGGPEFVVINANDAEVYGAEVTTILRPTKSTFLQANFSWLESQFLDFVLLQQAVISAGGAQVTINRELQNSGNNLLNSPRFKVSLTAEHTFTLGKYGALIPRYDGVWTDDTFFDATEGRGIPNNQGVNFLPENAIGQEAYWLHNARLAYRPPSANMELAIWVRNIENKAYKNFAFDGSTFQNTTIHLVGDPRTFGISVSANF